MAPAFEEDTELDSLAGQGLWRRAMWIKIARNVKFYTPMVFGTILLGPWNAWRLSVYSRREDRELTCRVRCHSRIWHNVKLRALGNCRQATSLALYCHDRSAMDLPSSRELELESSLRERTTQVSQLKDEVVRLRQYISSNPPTPTDKVTLPPSLVAVIQPHIEAASSGPSSSGSITTALTQRVKTLQEENDELYNLLKKSETGRLKEEVHGLSRVVSKLENALRESHKVIQSLSTELDKTHETFAKHNNLPRDPKLSPRNNYPQRLSPSLPTVPGKVPPTGPRSYKKPRLSDGPPKREENRGRNNHHHHGGHSHAHHRASSSRSQKMEVDIEGAKGDRERDRDDHDGNRSRKTSTSNGFPLPRNGSGGGGGGRRGGGPGGGGNGISIMGSSDRTLAERMGLEHNAPARF